jgi:3-deoxy-manno-octulosonate cytidylyltransferase (CMP-KDO synthetase)
VSDSFKVVIPARYGSSRLPGKPLLDLGGRPMIAWVYAAAVASGAEQVIVATDDARVAAACDEFGAEVAMTRSDHASGTDRVAQVAADRNWSPDTIVVNVQGDEPLLPPELVRQVAHLLADHTGAEMATLTTPINTLGEWLDPNMVNVISDQSGRALYFSRAPIPWPRDEFASLERPPPRAPLGTQRHVGIYAYRVQSLQRLTQEPPCRLEMTEQLEQLRALWLGFTILTAQAVKEPPHGVDTPADLEQLRSVVRVL